MFFQFYLLILDWYEISYKLKNEGVLCLLIVAGFNQLGDIVDKNSMRHKKIKMRYIPSDGIASGRRD
jgi:hypothetical protein